MKIPPVYSTSWKHSTSCNFNLNFVNIFKMAWNFLIRVLHSGQRLNGNRFSPLFPSETRDYPLIHTIYKLPAIISDRKLHRR